MMMFSTKLVALCILLGILVMFPIFFLWAQDDGSAVSSRTATMSIPEVATSTPSAAENPVPNSSVPRPMAPTPTPIPESAPVPTVPTNNQPVLSIAEPVDEADSTESSNSNPLMMAAIAGLVVLGGYSIYKLKTKEKSQNKNTEEEEKDESRCFDIKKLMDEKWEELTDLKGQLESKAKAKAREEIKEMVQGTSAAHMVASVENAEKEYTKFKQLYEKCMIELQNNKRVFIIHGWDGSPKEGWFPWLKYEFEKYGFLVEVPTMPEPAWPKIEAWVSHLAKVVGEVDENTFFVGHSIGCQTILRYLEGLSADKKVGGGVFAAGWFTLMNLKAGEEKEIARPWLETPIDFGKVREHTEKFFAIFSDNDEDVPLSNKELFEQYLGAKTVIEHGKGHFSGGDGIKELPLVLEKILELSNK